MSRFSFYLTAALLCLILSGTTAMAADEPPHSIVLTDGAIQIRDYEPQILAEVLVEGSMGQAGNRGFRPLAGYIFGDNQAVDGAPRDISMTTPVVQSRPQEIAMTTPVTQTQQGSDLWRVAFIMPTEWTTQTLPRPNDDRVRLREFPARRMAVIRFSGGASDRRFARYESELRDWIDANEYVATGAAIFARYDPPWVPTPFRRNEVMIEITEPNP